jgi:hypothetical protein
MSEAVRASARLLGLALCVGAAGALVLGVGFGLAQEEGVLRWIAYMLSILGALTLAFACFAGAPASARQHLARRLQKNDDEPEVPDAATGKPFVSEIVVLVTAGLLLIAAGTGLELLLP